MSKKDWFCWGMLAGCILTLVTSFVIGKVFSPPEPGAEVSQAEAPVHNSFSSTSSEVGVDSSAPAFSFDDLLDAIEWVESKGDANAKGDFINIQNEDPASTLGYGVYRAIGSFQLWKIYVDDVNRIQKSYNTPMFRWRDGQFTYRDRENKQRSREMVTIYLNHYGGTFEEMARKQNGGSNGHNKDCTKLYWEKVKARLETK